MRLLSALFFLTACNAADSSFIDTTADNGVVDDSTAALSGPTHVTLDVDRVLEVNGHRFFPLGVTMPPPPEAVAPSGKNAWVELKNGGVNVVRTGPNGSGWTAQAIAREQQLQDAAAQAGLYTWLYLHEAPNVATPGGSNELLLKQLTAKFRASPALLAYKGLDEPQWAGLTRYPLANMQRGYDVVKAADPDHPLVIIQAPRGTVADLKPYNAVSDIQGTDIYPVSYPPGVHSEGMNKDLSMVGDYTRKMLSVADGTDNGTWMTLQIAWSGVVNPGKTLRMPTFFEERYMAYDAIINGARGLIFFGGHLDQAWTASDANYGWAWSFWGRVLKPLLSELNVNSALGPALVASESPHKVTSSDEKDIELTVRETPSAVFVIACRRGTGTSEVTFQGLPATLSAGDVLYESPKKVTASGGTFSDWFAPHEVHVYRFLR
jgi:hypothetical protein